MRIFALVPGAGKSIRMGCPKLALPLGVRTVLERVLDTLREANLRQILVVLGPHVANLTGPAERAGASVLLLDAETPDMRTTVQYGLDWLEHHEKPAMGDAFLLLPADHPTLSVPPLAALLHAASLQPRHGSIWIPTHEGRRGHPTLVLWKHLAGIRAWPADQGLNSYLRAHPDETIEVPCSSPDILCDLDTPAAYDRLKAQFSK